MTFFKKKLSILQSSAKCPSGHIQNFYFINNNKPILKLYYFNCSNIFPLEFSLVNKSTTLIFGFEIAISFHLTFFFYISICTEGVDDGSKQILNLFSSCLLPRGLVFNEIWQSGSFSFGAFLF